VCPELDRDAPNDDRPKAEIADQLVDQRGDGELPLDLVLEAEGRLELAARILHP
jgi:hypothetical protein